MNENETERRYAYACSAFMHNSILHFFIHGSMKRKKKKKKKIQKSILIINFLFEIFINLLSEVMKALYFCLYSGRLVHARIVNSVHVFTPAERHDSDRC